MIEIEGTVEGEKKRDRTGGTKLVVSLLLLSSYFLRLSLKDRQEENLSFPPLHHPLFSWNSTSCFSLFSFLRSSFASSSHHHHHHLFPLIMIFSLPFYLHPSVSPLCLGQNVLQPPSGIVLHLTYSYSLYTLYFSLFKTTISATAQVNIRHLCFSHRRFLLSLLTLSRDSTCDSTYDSFPFISPLFSRPLNHQHHEQETTGCKKKTCITKEVREFLTSLTFLFLSLFFPWCFLQTSRWNRNSTSMILVWSMPDRRKSNKKEFFICVMLSFYGR